MTKKYIIELEDSTFSNGEECLWRVKGFKSLVFDKNGLGKLTPYYEPFKEKFNLGDEVINNNNNGVAIVITKINERSVEGFDRDGESHSFHKENSIKTGKYFDNIKYYVFGKI